MAKAGLPVASRGWVRQAEHLEPPPGAVSGVSKGASPSSNQLSLGLGQPHIH